MEEIKTIDFPAHNKEVMLQNIDQPESAYYRFLKSPDSEALLVRLNNLQYYFTTLELIQNPINKLKKTVFELSIISVLLIPVLLGIAIIYFLLLVPTKGRVIFKQQRIGLRGEPFTIYKFRTLLNGIDIDMEKDTAIILKHSHPLGIFLRKTGLDELPQFFNVIKGDMNVIGPRPLLMKDLIHLSQKQFFRRHIIKPGIIGLWQVRRKYTNDKSYFKYDDFYLKKQSAKLDWYIIFSTIAYVLNKKGR